MFDGTTQIFEGVTRPDYGTAVGVLPDKNILLVWDEQPDRKGVLTSAGGRLEIGESAEEGTKREFLEETGYEVGKLTAWFKYRQGGKVEYYNHFFIACDLTKVAEMKLDAGERIELKTFSFEDFLRLGSDDSKDIGGPVRDPILRIHLLEASLDKDKRNKLYSLLYD